MWMCVSISALKGRGQAQTDCAVYPEQSGINKRHSSAGCRCILDVNMNIKLTKQILHKTANYHTKMSMQRLATPDEHTVCMMNKTGLPMCQKSKL